MVLILDNLSRLPEAGGVVSPARISVVLSHFFQIPAQEVDEDAGVVGNGFHRLPVEGEIEGLTAMDGLRRHSAAQQCDVIIGDDGFQALLGGDLVPGDQRWRLVGWADEK